MGCETSSFATGATNGPRTLGKYVLYGVFSAVSCGVLVLIAACTLDGPLRRSWFDKIAGLVVVDQRVSAAPARVQPTPPEPAAAPPAAPPRPATPPGHPPMQESVDGRRIPDMTVLRPSPGGSAVLELDTGERLPLVQTLVLGRDPVPPVEFPDAQARLVSDEKRSISKTHFAIGRDDDGIWVVDLHSTNGVVATGPEGFGRDLVPGRRTIVSPGTRLVWGDRTAQVLG